ncbi:hypothetical protein HOP50_07g50350 [Chloropicon primus]|uniref:Polymerase nucleotidyl transferase domain-containing protein n=1 Tax=Chloropicon primus TaxID=1764295 RepID=A0A5B8MSZ7_9CHLO|nr:hypothetical protein A3770_07p50100 [Chloropicon primus]UPR01713.1 hypothetical protein HOP50_07g50350 [Chloropicon primus]|eukprot:QDZ22492.1 hypothetical protein A3770_07p50100 [Chloropicon primus]
MGRLAKGKAPRRLRSDTRNMVAGLATVVVLAYLFFAGALNQRGETREPRPRKTTARSSGSTTGLVSTTGEPVEFSIIGSNVTVETCLGHLERQVGAYRRGQRHGEDSDCFAGFGKPESQQTISDLQKRRQSGYQEAFQLSTACIRGVTQAVIRSSRQGKPVFSQAERKLLALLTQLQGLVKKGLFCMDLARELGRREPQDEVRNRVIQGFGDGAEFLLLGSIARDEANAFSDLDVAVLLREGNDDPRDHNDFAEFFGHVKASTNLAAADPSKRDFCYPASIGTFLSPTSEHFVGGASRIATVHNRVNTHTREGYENVRGMWEKSKPRQFRSIPPEMLSQALSIKMVVILSNMYLTAPWGAGEAPRREEYQVSLCENWMTLESEVKSGSSQTIRVPHRYFLTLNQRFNSETILGEAKEDLAGHKFSPKQLMLLVRAELYEIMWRNTNGEMCHQGDGMGVLDTISMLRSNDWIGSELAQLYIDVWLYSQSVLLVHSIHAWENCEQKTQRPLPLEGLGQLFKGGEGKVDTYRMSVNDDGITNMLASFLSRLAISSRDHFAQDAKLWCDFLHGSGAECKPVLASMAAQLGYRGDLTSLLSEH